MAFWNDIIEATTELGNAVISFMPGPLQRLLIPLEAPKAASSIYEDLKQRIELACKIQILKKSIEDKGLLSSKDRIEVFISVCGIWILCQHSETIFKASNETLTDEAEDLLYVAQNLEKENSLEKYFYKLYESQEPKLSKEAEEFIKDLKKILLNLFKVESKRIEFYQKPYTRLKEIMNQVPIVSQYPAGKAEYGV